MRMGERLAAEAPVEADLVMPIPDSGTPAAIGFAQGARASRSSEGLIKNRYVGRTFIQPDQELRQQGIRLKFNPLAEVAGKRVVVVDDSIVRGNTMRADRRDALRRRRRRGARARLLAAGRLAVLLRDRHGRRRTSSPRRTARSRRCASTSARPRSPTSRSRVCRTRRRLPEDAVCRACFTREYPTTVPLGAGKLRFEGGCRCSGSGSPGWRSISGDPVRCVPHPSGILKGRPPAKIGRNVPTHDPSR